MTVKGKPSSLALPPSLKKKKRSVYIYKDNKTTAMLRHLQGLREPLPFFLFFFFDEEMHAANRLRI